MKKLLKAFLDVFKGSKDFAFGLFFAAVTEEVKKIKNKALQNFVEQKLEPVREIADLFTDDDKNNRQQLKDWWEANKERLVDDHIILAADIIAGMKKVNAHTRAILVQQLVTLAAQNVFKTEGEEMQNFIVKHISRISGNHALPQPLINPLENPAPVKAVVKKERVSAKQVAQEQKANQSKRRVGKPKADK